MKNNSNNNDNKNKNNGNKNKLLCSNVPVLDPLGIM
jgi:hypothetical protein